jgi:hypothetical protein
MLIISKENLSEKEKANLGKPAPVMYRQIGWMPCVACKDAPQLKKGKMWVGGNSYITCVECKGKGEVPRYQVIDSLTGQEIDYETYGKVIPYGS